jgi:hypothetical protein
MFIGQALRSARKPACISAASDRATARASPSGQTPARGKRSCTVSAIAMVSQMITG